MRGTRPWAQFLRYTRDVANRKGSRLWAAQLLDPRNLAEMESRKRKTEEPARPGLEEWSPAVEALYLVANDLRLLVGRLTKSAVALHPGPEGPEDIIAKRTKQLTLSKIDEQLR